MIERLPDHIVKSLRELLVVPADQLLPERYVADAHLVDGRVVPTVFIHQEKLAFPGSQDAVVHELTQGLSACLKRTDLSRRSLSASRCVKVSATRCAVPPNLQEEIRSIGATRWTETIDFGAIVTSGQVYTCSVGVNDPYFFVDLPTRENAMTIEKILPVPDDAPICKQIYPSLCIYET